MSITVKRVLVTIKRDLDVITTECSEHELPILKRIHFAENVEVIEKLGELELDIPVQGEYGRMERRYGINPTGMTAFRSVYKDVDELADKLGVRNSGEAEVKPQSFMHKVHKPKAALAKPKAA